MRRLILFIFLSLALLLVLSGCGGDEPTSTPAPTFTNATEVSSTNTPAPLPQPTSTPVAIAPTQTPAEVAESQVPTATAPPVATPIPTVVIRVQDDAGNPIAGATVLLTNAASGFAASFATTADGQAIFTGVDVSTNTYRVEVTAAGFQTAATDVTIAGPNTEISITLETGEAGVTGVTTTLTNLRNGPGTNFDILVELPEGETLAIIGVDQSGEWLNVVTPDGTEGWVFRELVTVQGDLGSITDGAPSPNTPTPASTTDGSLTPTATATISGTVTPPTPVTALPTRPAPVPFDEAAFRAEMDELEFLLVQMGGLLDRVAQEGGQEGDCAEYLNYYAQIAATPVYSDVPGEWVEVHNEFQRVVDNTLRTNKDTATYCVDGAVGALSNFYYGQARSGIDEGLSLLFAVMAAADDLLSQ